MPDWSQLLKILGAAQPAQAGRTPPYAQGGTLPAQGGTAQQGAGQPPKQGTDWASLLPWMVGTGLQVTGNVLQGRAQGQQNQALQDRAKMMDQLARDEMARKEQYATLVLPSLMQALGNNDPGMKQMLLARMRSQPGYGAAPSAAGTQQPPQQTGQIGNVMQSPAGGSTFDANMSRFLGRPSYNWQTGEEEI